LIRRPYLKARKGLERLYKIDEQFKTVDKSGKEVSVPTSFLGKDETGFREVAEAIKSRIGTLRGKEIVGIGIVESAKATNVDWHTGDIIPGNLAYALVRENDSTVVFPFLKDPTENRIIELWVFDVIQRKTEKIISLVTIASLTVWTSLTIFALAAG
jgi:hypothetical protein